jgi:hypothetical protein
MSEYWGDITESEAQWKLARWGKFTASEMYHLAIGKKETPKSAAKMFGDGAITYIKKVTTEAYTRFNDRDDVSTKAMRNGNADEPLAYAHLCRLMGLTDLEYCGPDNKIFQKYCDNSGASPDALGKRPDGTVYYGAEIKCKTSEVHMDHLFEIGDDEELFRKKMFNFWVQCQFSIMTFKAKYWLFCYYNEFFPFQDAMKIIRVNPDPIFQSDLDLRLKQAIKIKYKIIDLRKEGYTGDISHLFN